MTTLLVMYVGFGVLLSVLSIPLILRKIGPNPFYGFRLKQTLEDPRVWYEANAYSGKGLFYVGLIDVITALAFTQIPGADIATYALSCMAVFITALTVCVVCSVRYMGRLTRAKAQGIRE